MKAILSIAKNEFRYLFYSPIAWFVLLVFVVQCAHAYTNTIHGIANIQEINLKNSPFFTQFNMSLTASAFLAGGFFSTISTNLFLFLPILTMGLINRDVNNGTQALLFSSPVSVRNVVMGKYLGIMLFNLLLVLVMLVFVVMGMMNIKSVDYGALLSALLAFFLYVCAFSALGMFMSSLSNSQVVSAIAAFMAMFALSSVGQLWQKYDFIRDLTWFLSLQNRADSMIGGLILSRDILYFLLVTGMFIAFTYFRISGKLESRPWYIRSGRIFSVIALVLLIGYFSSLPGLTGYLDATATKRNTIHPRTQQVLKEFGDSALEVTLYTNLFGQGLAQGLPINRNRSFLNGFWDAYLRFKPNVKFNYVYYYGYDTTKDEGGLLKRFPGKTLKDIAKDYCTMYDADPDKFLPADQLPPAINLKGEDHRLVMQLKYQGRTAFLRTYQDDVFWPDQYHMIAALKRVLGAPIPSLAYSTGSLERNVYKTGEREYGGHVTLKLNRKSLVNIGFDVDTINLHTQSIPDNLSALIMADPKVDLSEVVQNKIGTYIEQGGNLMINGEPGKQNVLNPLLSQLGVQLEQGQLVYPTFHETPDKVFADLSESSKELSESLTLKFKNKTPGSSFTIMMPGATAVIGTGKSGWQIDSLANTTKGKSWLKKGSLVIDSILPPFNPSEGDIRLNAFPTVKVMKRMINGKEQRVIISGDADFVSNKRINFNSLFLYPVYGWLTYNLFPVNTPGEEPEDTLLNIGERKAYYQKITFVWVLPSILLIAATVFLIRRKRK